VVDMGDALVLEGMCDVAGRVDLVIVTGTGVEVIKDEVDFLLATRSTGGRVVGDVGAIGLVTEMGVGLETEVEIDGHGADRSTTPDIGL